MTAPLPNTTVSVLGPDGQFTLPWRRWFQQLPGASSSSGLPGPPGPAGPNGPAGPPGTSATSALSLAALAGIDGSSGVVSVGLAAPAEFAVSGSPVTSSGTLTLTKATETANTVWAGPTSGPAAQPTFRQLSTADLSDSTARTTFTPTVTFGTPGDLSVSYTTQTGAYVKVGPMVLFWIRLGFTPTFTTASGNLIVSLPPQTVTDVPGGWTWPLRTLTPSGAWPSGATMVLGIPASGSTASFLGLSAAGGNSSITTTQIVSGTAVNLFFSGQYF